MKMMNTSIVKPVEEKRVRKQETAKALNADIDLTLSSSDSFEMNVQSEVYYLPTHTTMNNDATVDNVIFMEPAEQQVNDIQRELYEELI